jgi:hypothetical protein
VKENLKTNQAEYFNFVHASMQRTETHAYQKKTKKVAIKGPQKMEFHLCQSLFGESCPGELAKLLWTLCKDKIILSYFEPSKT